MNNHENGNIFEVSCVITQVFSVMTIKYWEFEVIWYELIILILLYPNHINTPYKIVSIFQVWSSSFWNWEVSFLSFLQSRPNKLMNRNSKAFLGIPVEWMDRVDHTYGKMQRLREIQNSSPREFASLALLFSSLVVFPHWPCSESSHGSTIPSGRPHFSNSQIEFINLLQKFAWRLNF